MASVISAPLHGDTMSIVDSRRDRPALSATRKNASRANQRRALGRTLLRLALPPPPPAVVPVRIQQSDQHTLHQRGLEGWHGPAACSGQREFGHGEFITPSPISSPCCCHSTSAREPPADANRREGPLPPRAPPHLPLPAGRHLPRIAAPPTCPAALPLI